MPDTLRLSLACGAYDINEALAAGEVTAQGIELTVHTHPTPERNWRMSRHLEFDVCEFSMGSYLVAHDQGTLPVQAIPVFPHRRYRHGFLFVNAGAGIRRPRDLEGRRVGIRTWQNTAGLWLRGILSDEYGVDLRSIEWVAQDQEDVPLRVPDGYRVTRVADGRSVTAMAESGDLDALIYPELPLAAADDGPIVRLLGREAEIEYFRKTGFFPIMHTVVVQSRIVDAHPWVARNLVVAFEQSKERAFRAMRDPRRVSLAWWREALEEQERILGPDPWVYGFAPNRAMLRTMIRFAREQALISRSFEAEELFVPSTLDVTPAYVR